MTGKLTLIRCLLVCSLIYNVHCINFYRQYKLNLYTNYFIDDRNDGIDYYMSLFDEGSNFTVYDFQDTSFIYEEHIVSDLSNCYSDASIHQKLYKNPTGKQADITIELESKKVNTFQEVLTEFTKLTNSDLAYNNNSTFQIFLDFHVCDYNYQVNSVIHSNEFVTFKDCMDVYQIFPWAVEESHAPIEMTKQGIYIFVKSWLGEFLNNKVRVEISILYRSMDDAINNNNPINGEFSFTTFGTEEFFHEETFDKELQLYDFMLYNTGSFGEEYPCAPC